MKKVIDIVVKVRNAASPKLKDVDRSLKRTGVEVKKTNADFTKFNRTLFTTAAFIGTFVKLFQTAIGAMDAGSQLERVSDQFERTLGTRGGLIKSMRSMSDNSIDIIESMRAGIALKSLGIIKNTQQLASIVTKAGTAAKLAGKDSGEGVKSFTEFLKTGNIENLQFLNLIAKTNPALKAQLAVLKQSGGVMGGVITDVQKLAIGQRLLTAATKGHLKGERDLRDVLLDAGQAFKLLRAEAGALLGKALGPIIDKVSGAVFRFVELIESTKKTDKGIQFLVKTLVVGTSAVLGFAAALGTLRLTSLLLQSVGIGLPGLLTVVLGLGAAFLGITKTAEGFTEKLSVLGNFIKGIYQLITSLDEETGIAKIDKEIADLLKKHGLLDFAQNIARLGSIVKSTFEDLIDGAQAVAGFLDDTVGGAFRKMISLFDGNDPWDNVFGNSAFDKMSKWWTTAKVILGAFAAFKIGKFALGSIGKLAGKGISRGSSFLNPLYVLDVTSGVKGAAGGILSKKGRLGSFMIKLRILGRKMSKFLIPILTTLGGALKTVLTSALFLKAALVAAAGALGWIIGSKINDAIDSKTQGTTKEGFQGNIVEQGMFKMSKLLGLDSARKHMDAESALANAGSPEALAAMRAKRLAKMQIGPDRPLTAPEFVEDSNQQEEVLASALATLQADKHAAFSAAISTAKESTSSGGTDITRDEWVSIFKMALDSSETQKTIADKNLTVEQQVNSRSER